MSNWSKISLLKFQQITVINETADMPELDKLLFCVCSVFGMTEYQLDNMGIKKAARLIKKVERIFTKPFKPQAPKRIGKFLIDYDPSKLTFGQYVELSFFLQVSSAGSTAHIQKAHYSLASISRRRWRKYESSAHRRRAEYFLTQPVERAMGTLAAFIENFKAFNAEYKGLFGLDKEGQELESPEMEKFHKRYGWIYSASQVAEYERITLEQAFALPIRQALNDLAYLKAKGKFDEEQRELLRKKLNQKTNV